jgi:predicted nucleic acid-binding protein
MSRNPLWHCRLARRSAAHGAGGSGNSNVRRAPDQVRGCRPYSAVRAAARYSEIVLARRQAGNPIEKFDALIAATALAAGASIATRDTGGFCRLRPYGD